METSKIDLHSPAIKALGSLFKLTEVLLRDDGWSSDNLQLSSCPNKHIRFIYDDDDDDVNDDSRGKTSSNTSFETSEESVVMEDADISQEMSALGLPLSFQTSKQHSSVRTKGKPEATQYKKQDSQSKLKDQVKVSHKVREKSRSDSNFQDRLSNISPLSLPDQTDLSCSGSDVSYDTIRLSNSCDGEMPANVAGYTGYGGLENEQVPRNMSSEALINDLVRTNLHMENKMIFTGAESAMLEGNASCGGYMFYNCVKEHSKEIDRSLMERIEMKGSELGRIAMQLEDLGSSVCNEQAQVVGMPSDSEMVLDNDDNDVSLSYGEWNACWDSFYMRYYFYNTKTQESTWYPPPGMENLALGDICNVIDESNTKVIGTIVDPAISHNEEEQSDQCELVDKNCVDDQISDELWFAQELTTEALSSESAMLIDIPCAVNSNNHHVLDGNCQDDITLSSSHISINHSQSPKNERECEGSALLCTGGVVKVFEPFGSSCENANNNDVNLITQLSDASSLSSTVEAVCDDDLINHVHMEELETATNGFCVQYTLAATKQKAKRKNRRKKSSNKNDNHELQPVEEYYVDITKYWCQRYLLFSKFDDGIQMDEEGWFSVTPEAIAKHHASRAGGGIVIDCFAGVGGNAIQFAKTSKHVIAIDIDPKKIDYAHHNAAIYGVKDTIEFINGDCFSLVPKLKVDTVFLSPPWGGPDYLKLKSYDISMLQPFDGQFLFNTFKVTASLIIMFLPRNIDVVQLAELSLSSDTPWSLEVEKNYLNGKLKAVTAYFSKIS